MAKRVFASFTFDPSPVLHRIPLSQTSQVRPSQGILGSRTAEYELTESSIISYVLKFRPYRLDMKRKDLPGLYWDETKQRYFPISSKPRTKPPIQHIEPEPGRGDSGPSRAHNEPCRNRQHPSSLAYVHTRVLRNNNLTFSQKNDIRMYVLLFLSA